MSCNRDGGENESDAVVEVSLTNLLAERGKTHGPKVFSHDMTGRIWAAILSQWMGQDLPPIPGHIVALCMIGVKQIRAAYIGGATHYDNYDDMQGYARIAGECAGVYETEEPK